MRGQTPFLRPHSAPARHGHSSTPSPGMARQDRGITQLMGQLRASQTRDRNCLLHIPGVQGAGREPQGHRGSSSQPTWAAAGDECEVQTEALPCGTKMQFCRKKLLEHTHLGFPGSSHSFAFALRVWFYYAELSAKQATDRSSIQNSKQPGPAACHRRPNRASSACTSGSRADTEAADPAGRTGPGLPSEPEPSRT